MSEPLFVRHQSGERHGLPVLTWSRAVRRELERLSALELPPTDDVWVPGAEPYGLSTSLPATSSAVAAGRAADWSMQLQKCANEHDAVLFDDLLGPAWTVGAVRHLVVALREAIVSHFGDRRAAMVPPISPASSSESQFPLHCDLYAADRLWNIFTRCEDERSGAALLLALDRVDSLLAGAGAPVRVRREVNDRVSRVRKDGADSFDRLMWLLYADEHPWSRDFAFGAIRDSIRVPALSGHGYLLDDSHYLHGRELSSREITGDRLLRLVFAVSPVPAVRAPTSFVTRALPTKAPAKAPVLA